MILPHVIPQFEHFGLDFIELLVRTDYRDGFLFRRQLGKLQFQQRQHMRLELLAVGHELSHYILLLLVVFVDDVLDVFHEADCLGEDLACVVF
jgi:hypothetical protein